MFLYKEIDFPQVPNELFEVDFLNMDTVVNDLGYGKQHTKNGQIVKACQYSYTRIKYQPLVDWLSSLLPGLDKSRMMLQQQTNIFGPTHIVHSDIGRSYALNYIRSIGGDNVVTSWYQEKNKPLKRKKFQGGQQADSGFVDYNNLEVLGSTIFQQNKWYLLATDILHDVDNITGIRQSITINFRDNSHELFTKFGI